VDEARRMRPDLPVHEWDWTGDVIAGVIALDLQNLAQGLPAVLESSPALPYLSLPSRLAPLLRAHHLVNLRGPLHFSGEGTADLRALTDPLEVTDVGGYKVSVKLDPRAFPSLAGAELRVTRRFALADWVSQFHGLRHLLVSPAFAEMIAMLPDSLLSLHLVHGHVEELDFLRHLRGLVLVQINDLPKLTSIEALAHLPNLEEVLVAYCARADMEPLLRCPKLRYVTALRAGGLGPVSEPLRRMLVERGGEANF
jgi:hypothetical protein